jgi:hypothetical protein
MPSLFNRPTWAKPHNTNEDEDADVNIFSHSGSFQEIVADQERRKKEKLERKTTKAERRGSGKRVREKDEEKDGLLKKRRITLEDGEALLNSVGLSANFASGTGNGSDDSDGEVTELVRRSPRKNKRQHHEHLESPLKSSSRRAEVLQIQDSSDDNDDPVIQHVRTVQPPEETESDEEFAELRRKARLQREQSGHNNRHPGNADAATRTSSSVGDVQDHRNKPPILEDEPVVQLFIQSRIPDTKELLVYRKLSQRLEEVRKNWCNKQSFPHEFWPNVFFIHRMRRCYDVTTCKSLGLEVDAFGNLTMKGAEGKEGVEKVHLQAVTQEIYDALLAERDLEAKQRSGELPTDDQADAGAEGEDASNEDPYIRVVMVAKNSEDLKLRIKPVSRPIGREGVSVQQLTCCLDYTLL